MKKILTLTLLSLALVILKTNLHAQITNPCNSINTIVCGTSVHSEILPGTGAYDFYPEIGYTITGMERIYSFAPAVTGKYTLSVTNTDFNSIQYMYKNAAPGCSQYSWLLIGSANSGGSEFLIGTLQAGAIYYLLLDASSDYSGAIHDFTINCTTGFDPCPAITSIDCNNSVSFNMLPGPGAIDIASCFTYNNTPDIGKETIYTYTPSVSGKTGINVTAITGGDGCTYYIKPAAMGCNSSNWICLGGVSSLWSPYYSNPYEVTAGITYYIMVDAVSLSGAAQTFNLMCPETADPCASITPLTCNTPATAVIPPGFGAYDTVGEHCVQFYNYYYHTGKEVIYTFTATVNGVHQIEITATDYKEANYMIKEAASGCTAQGWSCIGNTSYPGSLYTSVPLTAGTTYYLMLDATTPEGANHTFNIHCDPPYDPCPGIQTISCGTSASYNLPEGRGAFMTYVPSWMINADGKEALFEFTPSVTGTHLINFTSHSGSTTMFFIKEAFSGCNVNGWIFVGSPPYSMPGSIVINKTLVAGTTYFIMADTYYNNFPPGTTGSFEIVCPSAAYNPCAVITPIPSCGTIMITSHDEGLGMMAPFPQPGNYVPPALGKENIFSFTPSATGKYRFMADPGTGTGIITYAIKAASSGCNGEGWLEIGQFYNTPGYNYETAIRMELVAGTTYFILADMNDTLAKSQTFYLICPIPFNPCTIIPLICGEYDYRNFPAGNGAYSFSCGTQFPQGGELIYSFTPEETGQYLMDGSSGPGVNMYIKESSGGCNGSGWACVGNEFFGTIYTQTPMPLQAGVEYFIMFQAINDYGGYGYLNFRMGCQADCKIYADADGDGHGDPSLSFSMCGGPYPGYSSNNNDCNDANENIHPGVTEICGNQIDDNCNGQVDEGCGCGMTVNAGSDESTFFGYSADQIFTRAAVVTGGTAPYSYSWTMNRPLNCNQQNSNGDEIFMLGTCTNTICPTTGSLVTNPVCTGSASIKVKMMDTTEICITVTDVNGCIATDCFIVNATDARCFAGNSNIQKVIMCHHTGNPNKPWVQICVDENAVANLVAQGDYIGNCVQPRYLTNDGAPANYFILAPNPANSKVDVIFESASKGNYIINVTDLTGRIVKQISGIADSKNNSITIDLEQLLPGVYFISFNKDAQQQVQKLIIE